MAHEIESFMYVGQKPWHNLGVPLDNPPTVEEAIAQSGLQWRVNMQPVYASLPDGRKILVPDAKATVRESDDSVLGIVSDSYRVLQNKDAFAFFQPFLDANEATIECAGSLRQGKRVFVLCKIKRDPLVIAKGDEVEKYILLSNSHDGMQAVRVGFTPIRVVCANTLALAHNNEASKLIRVRHSAQMHINLDKIREIMNAADATFQATAEQYKYLASRDINQMDLYRYVKQVFNINKDVDSSLVSKIVPLFEHGKGNDMASIRGAWWAAYNAVTEYLTHERGSNADTRLDSNWFGNGKSLTQDALTVALKLAG